MTSAAIITTDINELVAIEYSNQIVITTEQLAQVYGTDSHNIQVNFSRNKDKFTEGKHYFLLAGDELKTFKSHPTNSDVVNKFSSQLYLWTERGANRHCKVLDTDKAWEQFDNLEECYFKVKESSNNPRLPKTYKEALQGLLLQVEENEKLQIENKQKEELIKAQAPKVIFADAVSSSYTSILVGDLAKILKQNGIDTGQNRLFEWLRSNGYLIKRQGADYNMPTQRSMEMGLFEIKEGTRVHADGHISITKTTKVTGKGQIYFINKLKPASQLALAEA